MRALLVIGTRPEVIKCFPVVDALRERPGVEVVTCVTGQHRHILDEAMDVVGMSAEYDLQIMREKPSLKDITCDVLQGLEPVLDKVRPDLVLVQGDTTTAMAASLAAFYARVSVGHIEAGLLSGNKFSPWPEEINRRLVTVLADMHFAPTVGARANLLKINIPSERIFVTGNTVIDALLTMTRRLELADYLSPAIAEVVAQTNAGSKRLILVTAHRRENWGDGIDNICRIAKGLAQRGDVQIAIPVHPNPKVRKPMHRALSGVPGISLLEPLDYRSFVDLMRRSHIVLTDSGGVQEEAPALGKPVLVLRDVTERPEGIAAGAARLVGLDPARVIEEASRLLDDPAAYQSMSRCRNPYGDGTAAEQIAEIVVSRLGDRAAGRARVRPEFDQRARESGMEIAFGSG